MTTNSGFWEAGLEATVDRLNACLIQLGTLADRPAVGQAGRIYVLTDTASKGVVYRDSGTAWVEIIGVALAAGVASLRTLGTGSTQAAAGDHVHAPALSAAVTGNETGGSQSLSATVMHNGTSFAAITDTISRTAGAASRSHFCAASYWGTNGLAGQADFRLMYDGVQKVAASHAGTVNLMPGRTLTHLVSSPSVASHTLVLEGKVADTADRIASQSILIAEVQA
jgi:hypothetical protein